VVPNLTLEDLRIPGVAGWINQTRWRPHREFVTKNLEGGEAKFKPVDELSR